MCTFTRRRFIGFSAAAASVAAFAKLPSALTAARSIGPAKPSMLSVKHVVVLMQENRSFDHYFGTLRGVRGLDDPAALCGTHRKSVFEQGTASPAISIKPFALEGSKDAACIADLDHSWRGTHAAWNEGRYDQWATAKGPASMGHLRRKDIPFHYALADGFTLCDNYFCSVMGPTKPNRLYLWSGTIDPQGIAGGPVIDNGPIGLGWTTYPERLQAAGVTWKVYQNADDNFDDNALAWFASYRDAKPGSALHERGIASVPRVHLNTCEDIVSAIESDALNGVLPTVSWIVPPEACSEHPGGTPDSGAEFIAKVIAALTADPNVWASTVLLINYDENDGFFDHVPPPVAPRGTPDEFVDGEPIGLGPRVPLFAISPWSRGGHVCSEVFDHTSVLQFLEKITGVKETNISQWRRQLCGDLLSAFEFHATDMSMPALPMRVSSDGADACPAQTLVAALPTAQALQECGWRSSRVSPYALHSDIGIDLPRRCVTLALGNAGTRPAQCAIHDLLDETAPIERIDVPPGDRFLRHRVSLRSDARYDVLVHGPDGFVTHAAGCAADDSASIDVALLFAERYQRVHQPCLVLSNAGNSWALFELTCAIGGSKLRTVLAPQHAVELSLFQFVDSNGRYDVTSAVYGNPDFTRRFAGRVPAQLGNSSNGLACFESALMRVA